MQDTLTYKSFLHRQTRPENEREGEAYFPSLSCQYNFIFAKDHKVHTNSCGVMSNLRQDLIYILRRSRELTRVPDDPEQSEHSSSQWRLLQRTMDSKIEGCHEQPCAIPSFRQ